MITICLDGFTERVCLTIHSYHMKSFPA